MASTRNHPTRSRWQLAAAVALGVATALGACTSPNNPDTIGAGGGGPSYDATVCAAGHQGCACSTPGDTISCGELVSTNGSYVSCQQGTSTCQPDGTWGACQGNTIIHKMMRPLGGGEGTGLVEDFHPVFLSLDGGSCDPCDPNIVPLPDGGGIGCNQYDAGAPYDAGLLQTDAGYTIPPTTIQGGGGGGDAGVCMGLQCQVDWTCPKNSQTTLTGKVYDPVMQNPLYNAYVYIPIDPNPANLPAFSSGASCDSCSGITLNAVAVAITDVNGNFTLTNVPTTAKAPNNQIPLVVQMGKWRRVQMLTTVPDCTTTAIPASQSRLPTSKFDGYNNTADIPRMAIASGSADPFECMMLRMGIDPAEFQLPGSGSRRIDFYHANGKQYQGGNTPDYSQLVGSTSALTPYDVVLLPCEGGEDDNNDTYADFVSAYTLAGGRMFTTHFGYTWLATPSNYTAYSTNPVTGNKNIFYPVATWDFDYQNNSATAQIDTGFSKGATFQTWMDQLPAPNAGVVTNGSFTLYDPRHDLDSVNTKYATEWMHDTSWASPWPFSFTFNTPLGAGVGDAGTSPDGGGGVCGRVVYSDFHVSTSAFVSGGGNCASDADCGYGSTCSTGTLGTCSTQACNVAADCGDSSFTCSGGNSTAGSGCTRLACSHNYDCNSGVCTSGHCGCNTNGDCGALGTCTNHACTYPAISQACTRSRDCRGSGQSPDGSCNAPTLTGTCQSKSCNTTTQCDATANGHEQCTGSGGTCSGCYASTDCPGTNQTCVGAVAGGTCTGNSGQFPNVCAKGPLDAQESALEFMLLDLTACVTPDNQPPPGPPQPTTVYNSISFTVDFQATCPMGSRVRWRQLDWQALIPAKAIDGAAPSGSSIVFAAQTQNTPDSGAVTWTGVPSATIATATSTTANLPTGWDGALIDTEPSDGGTGTGAFDRASPQIVSGNLLHVTVTLNPSTDKQEAPTLQNWQVQSDCVPNE